MDRATRRRLQQELGIETELEHLFTFRYQARYLDVGSEHEMCWVFAGYCDEPPRPNRLEIAAIRWISPDELDRELAETPDEFSPWFMLEWPRVRASLPTDRPTLP